MDRLGAPGCTSCLLMSQGHDYLIRCHLPSLVAEELALARCVVGVGGGAHRGRHTCLSQVHSLKLSIYTETMPWFCSEAHLRLGVTKEQAVVSKSSPACLTSSAHLHCVLLVNGHP